MLRELHISGLGVIDDLDLSLHPGLNVLTGETGAGKTMITVGLALALGARASASLVREGAPAARVQALFDLADPGLRGTEAIARWADDSELVLARSVTADGKGSARIGGQLATASALSTLGAALVEVHGQHQAQGLLRSAVQTAFLDRFAGDAHLVAVASHREAHETLAATTAAMAVLGAADRDRERELDLLRYQIRDIEAVMPEAGEWPRLLAEEARLGHIERLAAAAMQAGAALSGDDADTAAVDQVGAAARALDEAASLDPGAREIAARAATLAIEAVELARDVRDYGSSLTVDPDRLQHVRERLHALRGLQRKYGETETDVLEFLGAAHARLEELAGADERSAELTLAAREQAETREARAEVVTAGRRAAAGRLASAIGVELDDLGMPGAVVDVMLHELSAPGPAGAERVELRFASGTGARSLPLAKTASGGELSRTMLACRSVLADIDDVPTLVFDEVDAGIGGRAGLAVGRRLARLARGRQIVVVTHLPQIACFADRHVRVTKLDQTAEVETLDDEGRIAELSRMLAGLDESAGAISHAEELLREASKEKAGV